jgi:hypothetical protein
MTVVGMMSMNSVVADVSQRAQYMTNDRQRFRASSAAGAVGSFLLNVMVIAWQVARVLIVAILVFVEPIIGFVLCGLALVGVVVSVILKFSGAPNFPFWPALAMSVGLYLAFLLYVVVVRSLVPQPRED